MVRKEKQRLNAKANLSKIFDRRAVNEKNFQFRKMNGTQLTWESSCGAKEEATRLALLQYFGLLRPEVALKYLNLVDKRRDCKKHLELEIHSLSDRTERVLSQFLHGSLELLGLRFWARRE